MSDVALEDIAPYACEDADITIQLFQKLKPALDDKSSHIYETIEKPLVYVLKDIEKTGFYVDRKVLRKQSDEITSKIAEIQKEIFELSGEEFNISSTQQLRVILFEKLKIHEKLGVKRIKKNKSGYSTDSSVLEKLSEDPLCAKVLEFRTLSKLLSTYINSLPLLIHEQTGRVHSSFHQTGTATGRLSSSDPNLQNIPIRTLEGQKIREAFRAESEESLIFSADYSQVELRLLAHLAEEEVLISAFENGEDIHRQTAAKIFQVDPDNVDSTLRSRAKTINFGVLYGMGHTRLARETGVSQDEAKEFIEAYFKGFPKISTFLERAKETASDKGYTETIFGRRRILPKMRPGFYAGNLDNIAINTPVQGSAADIIKMAMVRISRALKEEKMQAKMLLQVHDELVFECPKSELEKLQSIVKEGMEGAAQLKVKLKIESGYGQSWLEAH